MSDPIDDSIRRALEAHDAGLSAGDQPTVALPGPDTGEASALGELPGHSVQRLIARGGMGAVYLAQQKALQREVAIKVMTAEADSPEMAARFRREALVLGQLEHPNIVPIHDVGEDEEGGLFYTMKLVKGRTLQFILNELRNEDPEMLAKYSLASLLTVFRKVCDAMAFAHSQGVLHRDLKPENIMVGEFGEVLVMDWGLAKRLKSSTSEVEGAPLSEVSLLSPGATLQGQVMGTPQYMSPEQARGEVDSLDFQSDVFSLGGILYAILTLRAPVEGSTAQEVLEKVRSGEITSPAEWVGATSTRSRSSGKGELLQASAIRPLPHLQGGRVPAAISAVAMKALALEKGDRYREVASLAGDVESFQSGFATTAEEAGAARQLALFIRRNKGVSLAAALAVAVITLLSVSFLFRLDEEKQVALREKEGANQNAYASDMLLVDQAWKAGNIARVEELLERNRHLDHLHDFEWDYWQRQLKLIQTLTLHSGLEPKQVGTGFTVQFHPDGAHLLTTDRSLAATVWNVKTGKRVRDFRWANCLINEAAWVPGGEEVVTTAWNRTSQVWDRQSGGQTALIEGHLDIYRRIAVHPDGRRLVTVPQSFSDKLDPARVWDLETGEVLAEIPTSVSRIGGVAFDPKGQLLALPSRFYKVQVWEVDGPRLRFEIVPESSIVEEVAFSPDGLRLACAESHLGSISIWNTESGEREKMIPVLDEGVGLQCIAFSPDGRFLVCGGEDNSVRVIDVESTEIVRTYLGHRHSVRDVTFSPDGMSVASICSAGEVKVWVLAAAEGGHSFKWLTTFPIGVDIQPDGRSVAVAGPGSVAHLYDARTGVLSLRLKGDPIQNYSVAFRSDGEVVATGGKGEGVTLWNVGTGAREQELSGRGSEIIHLQHEPDGKRLAFVDMTSTFYLWDPGSDRAPVAFEGHGERVWTAEFSRDGRRLVSSSADGTVRIWDASTGEQMGQPIAVELIPMHATFHPDGRHVLCAGDDGVIRTLSLDQGRETGAFKAHDGVVRDIGFTPDGRRLVSAGSEGRIKLWNPATGREMLELATVPGRYYAGLAISSDGRRIAASFDVGAAYLWDARPWTPEAQTEFEARGLLNFWVPLEESLSSLRRRIRASPILRDELKELALEWAELFWNRRQK